MEKIWPELKAAVLKHKLSGRLETAKLNDLELTPHQIAGIREGALRYQCSETVFLRALLEVCHWPSPKEASIKMK